MGILKVYIQGLNSCCICDQVILENNSTLNQQLGEIYPSNFGK